MEEKNGAPSATNKTALSITSIDKAPPPETLPGPPITDIDKVPRPAEKSLEQLEITPRGYLAFGLLALFAVTVALSFIALMWGPGGEAVGRWLDIVLPVEAALLGAASAFYFAARKQ